MNDNRKSYRNGLDRAGGKLFHRALGLVMMIPTLIAAWGLWWSYTASNITGMVLCGAATLGFGLIIRWLFSRHRRLSDVDFHQMP